MTITRPMTALSVFLMTLTSACASGGSERAELAALDASAARGKAIAEERCAACHAIGPSGMSDNPRAPLWREFVSVNDADALKLSFSEGRLIRHEGPDPMPEFTYQPGEIDDLVAYMKTLREG